VFDEATTNNEFLHKLRLHFQPVTHLLAENVQALGMLEAAKNETADHELKSKLEQLAKTIQEDEAVETVLLKEVVINVLATEDTQKSMRDFCTFLQEKCKEHKNSPDIRQAGDDPEFVESFRYQLFMQGDPQEVITFPLWSKAHNAAFALAAGEHTSPYHQLANAILVVDGNSNHSYGDALVSAEQKAQHVTMHLKSTISLLFTLQDNNEALNDLRTDIRARWAAWCWDNFETRLPPS
jgi:hypothetical protein